MGKIVFFITAPGSSESLAKLLGTLNPESVEDIAVISANMDDAVRIASAMQEQEVDVLVARGNTEIVLRRARLPFGIASIPISNQEVVDAIREAQQLCNKNDLYLGFSGFHDHIDNVKVFLDFLNIRIKFYENVSAGQLHQVAQQAKKDGIDAMISGKLMASACRQIGLPSVEMRCSYSSILAAYQHALEMQYAFQRQRGSLEELYSIYNAFSCAIFVTDANGIITSCNKAAAPFLSMLPENPVGHPLRLIPVFRDLKVEALFAEKGKDNTRHILRDGDDRYLLDAAPLSDAQGEGCLLTLYPADWLTEGEITLRKEAYQRQAPQEEDMACFFDKLPMRSAESRIFLSEMKGLAGSGRHLLLYGEAGCGKEMLACTMHHLSERPGGPFVVMNCCSTAPNGNELLHAFEEANGGTLLLNDVGELSPTNQAILLRFLRERSILYSADGSPLSVDVRLIAATADALEHRSGFRRDLLYLLGAFTLRVPPLRAFTGDLPAILDACIERAGQRCGKEARFSDQARKFLAEQPWPGNLKQLLDFCERLILLSRTKILSEEFVERQLSACSSLPEEEQAERPPEHLSVPDSRPLVIKGRAVPVEEVARLLHKHHGKKNAVAAELGISRTTLWKCLHRLE